MAEDELEKPPTNEDKESPKDPAGSEESPNPIDPDDNKDPSGEDKEPDPENPNPIEPDDKDPSGGEENPNPEEPEDPEDPEDPEEPEKPKIYRSALRTVTIIFGSLFNKLYIRRYNPDGSINTDSEPRLVPITFSPKEQYYVWLANTMRRPDNGTKVGIRLPRLSYELTGFAPDPQRQVNPYLYNSGKPIPDPYSPFAYRVQSPAAYSFNFTLSLWANDMDTSIQVLENILPYFKPEVSVKIKEQEDIPIVNDVHVIFNGISKQDNYTEGFEVNRFIQWDMEFTVYSNIWTPTVDGKIITEVTVDINDQNFVSPDIINGSDCCYED